MPSSALAPTGLLCELLAAPEKTVINRPRPRFGWIVNDAEPGAAQSAYQVLVATDPARLGRGEGDLWDSGRVESPASLNVRYSGAPLPPGRDCFWQVRTWNGRAEPGPWSAPQRFRTGEPSSAHATARYPLEKTEFAPKERALRAAGHHFFDFGRAVFGTVRVDAESAIDGATVEVHLGEKLAAPGAIDRQPPGHIRYRGTTLTLRRGTASYVVAIPPDKRNSSGAAILMPPEAGEVLPFRYCELVADPRAVRIGDVRQVMVHYPFDDNAAAFASSSPELDAVWELCKHSIRATTFCGVYVDGDRERIPYEADAYINQLGHYCVDREFSMARHSHEYLLTHPTWPTEWILHSVLMAWADYEQTGDPASLEANYDTLVAKALLPLAREDGLISTQTGLVTGEVLRSIHIADPIKDIVDWPPGSFTQGGTGERDGHEMMPVNTVVNAFHCRALALLARIAGALGRKEDAGRFAARAELVAAAINARLFDPARGVYLDGEGSGHASLHASMFPLAFGLVPPGRVPAVAAFVKSRGMACSVYGAQFLLEALYAAGESEHALGLLTSESDRGWLNMIRAGSTMTLEAWDWKYKNNLDWNHAWGAAPANIIPRCLMGVTPLEPGFGRIRIRPQPGTLERAELRLPTIRGTVGVRFERSAGRFRLEVEIPGNATAEVWLPGPRGAGERVMLDGRPVKVRAAGDSAAVDDVKAGRHTLET
ncbi:MAG TPA: family 78 glycoside hydrolase catalytic domain [Planctomycetota bacterium]|nr:family 78 glycoside hydrolase catalytic domain [Planctomycetota bacterium]